MTLERHNRIRAVLDKRQPDLSVLLEQVHKPHNLSAILNTPFEVVEHKAAIRPTVKDRRPFIGFHPEYSSIGIFNGMGTKGISLAPFFANHFTEHLLHQKPLMKEVDIKRFL